jgi:hypothetical protein
MKINHEETKSAKAFLIFLRALRFFVVDFPWDLKPQGRLRMAQPPLRLFGLENEIVFLLREKAGSVLRRRDSCILQLRGLGSRKFFKSPGQPFSRRAPR